MSEDNEKEKENQKQRPRRKSTAQRPPWNAGFLDVEFHMALQGVELP
ncbi:MAG: hypothetical protein WB755_28945 [Terriglobales bacterium]|jgi:hypothetical protein